MTMCHWLCRCHAYTVLLLDIYYNMPCWHHLIVPSICTSFWSPPPHSTHPRSPSIFHLPSHPTHHVTLTVAHGPTIIKFPSKIYYQWLIDIEDGTLLRSVVTTRTFLHSIQGTEQSGVVQYMCRVCTNSSIYIITGVQYTHCCMQLFCKLVQNSFHISEQWRQWVGSIMAKAGTSFIHVCPFVLDFWPFYAYITVVQHNVPTCLLHNWHWNSCPVQYCPPFLGLHDEVHWTPHTDTHEQY